MARTAARSARTETYRYPESDVALRPEVGTQPQFRKEKPPVTYSYDSPLSPSRMGREEWRPVTSVPTSTLPPPAVAG
jgi:hypothetical protein